MLISKRRNKILCGYFEWYLKWNTNAPATDNFLYIEWKMAENDTNEIDEGEQNAKEFSG